MARRRWLYSHIDDHLVAEYHGSECVYFDPEYYDAQDSHQVIPDIDPFMSPDGQYITGRGAWREHLKRTDSIEMGHSDVKAAQEGWAKRKAAHIERLKHSAETVRDVSHETGEVKPFKRSNLNVEIANRLHGRPTPERKELIKLSLDLAKRMGRR